MPHTKFTLAKFTLAKFILIRLTFALILALAGGACSTAPQRGNSLSRDQSHKEQGLEKRGFASWYGRKFHHKKTASGERYNMYAFTAAHRSLPFGTQVRVQNLRSKKTVIVRINDRGPFSEQRVIDLSYAAGTAIGLINSGYAPVELEILHSPKNDG